MPKKLTLGKQAKYRVKKTIRDANVPLGTDYTPEALTALVPGAEPTWRMVGQVVFHTEEEAIEVLKRFKALDDVKVEYIYPKL